MMNVWDQCVVAGNIRILMAGLPDHPSFTPLVMRLKSLLVELKGRHNTETRMSGVGGNNGRLGISLLRRSAFVPEALGNVQSTLPAASLLFTLSRFKCVSDEVILSAYEWNARVQRRASAH